VNAKFTDTQIIHTVQMYWYLTTYFKIHLKAIYVVLHITMNA